MKEAELTAILMDWFADYSGTCSCSQQYGRQKYEEARARVLLMKPDERRVFLSRLMRQELSDERLAQGYGWEDAGKFARFLEDEIGVG